MAISPSTGIFWVGFVFGYLLYYAVKHTEKFSIELLSSAIGAVGGATVIGLLGTTPGWIGPYGAGLAAGFLFYLVLTLILSAGAAKKALFISQALLGAPRE